MSIVTILLLVCQVASAIAKLNASILATRYFTNDSAWYLDRIPLFESSIPALDEVYYYRWSIFRAHQRDLGNAGYISTEFLNDVSWQTNPGASLNDATGFHLLEGRWCRDRRFKDDYAKFMYGTTSNAHQFSESMADAVWQSYLVDGVKSTAISLLGSMQSTFTGWNGSLTQGSFDNSKGLYWVEPLADATEYSISSIDASGGTDGFRGGHSFRPSINSYQYANARAIANIAELQGDRRLADTYNSQAESIKRSVQNSLWNSTFQHFMDRYRTTNNYVKQWDFISGRELVGYVPWAHDLPDDNLTYARAWKHILNTEELAGPFGLRTVEPSYKYYMRQYRYEGTKPECQWNGPVWPYQTTQALKGMANLLDHYPNSAGIVTTSDYTRLLVQYARLHYNPTRGGTLNLEEDYDPATGRPIVGLSRSLHYFHSGFNDLILTGLVGIRPRADDILEINPLAHPAMVSYFRAERIIYHGHDISVQWDDTGARYGSQGLLVEVDGSVVAKASGLTRLVVNITRQTPPPVKRPLAVSVQLQADSKWPQGSVSTTNSDVKKVHSAIDGRVWFFPEPEASNGWDTAIGNGNGSEIWYQIDFGGNMQVSNAEIGFFANNAQGFDVPESYRIQIYDGTLWKDLSSIIYAPLVANGITKASWDATTTNRIRLYFLLKRGAKARLVEFKVLGASN